jgi:hypothetical protein
MGQFSRAMYHNYFKNNLDVISSAEIFSDGVEEEVISTDF